MTILGIETATETASVGITAQPPQEVTWSCQRTLSRDLVTVIDRVLMQSRLGLADLEGLALSIGPGSFTGLRVGLAVAKGIALAAGLPLVPVRTLDALADQVPVSPHPVAVVQKSRKGEVYFACYAARETGWAKTVPEQVVSLSGISRLLPPRFILIGNARDQVVPLLPPGRVMCPEGGVTPSGLAVARLGISRWPESKLDKSDRLEPYYVKEPDAKAMKNENL